LHGWFFPADTDKHERPLAALICHGNAGNISHRLPTCQLFLDLGASVFVFDYRGYGRSHGRPTEEGTYQDAVAAYQWLRNKGFGPDQIVAFGESLGGAVAAELALRQSVRGLILVSTFTSIPAVGAELFPFLPTRWLCTIQYNTIDKLPRLQLPLLIMHSQADTIISYRHGQALYAAANEPKTLWQLRGDHNDTLLVGADQCREGLRQFLLQLRAQPQASQSTRRD
jgi:fermentation-respiration switch protein FrsA (DUF1100 family)